MYIFFRMPVRRRVTHPWSRLLPVLSPSEGCKCEQDVPFEATWQKSMPCIGAPIPAILYQPHKTVNSSSGIPTPPIRYLLYYQSKLLHIKIELGSTQFQEPQRNGKIQNINIFVAHFVLKMFVKFNAFNYKIFAIIYHVDRQWNKCFQKCYNLL